MTANEQTHSKTRAQVSQKSETVSPKAKPHVQKDRQEAKQRKDKTFKDDWEKRQKETQEYMYSQSSRFSSVSRSLIFGIIGTIWVITYSDGHMRIPNWALLFSLLADFFFYLVMLFITIRIRLATKKSKINLMIIKHKKI